MFDFQWFHLGLSGFGKILCRHHCCINLWHRRAGCQRPGHRFGNQGAKMSESDERTIGRLEVMIETLEDQVERMSDDVREIRELLASAKGGYRRLIAVGLVSSAVGQHLQERCCLFFECCRVNRPSLYTPQRSGVRDFAAIASMSSFSDLCIP